MAPSSEVICILSDDEEGGPANGSQPPTATARAQPAEVVNLISSSDNSKSEGQRQTVSHLVPTPHRLRMLLSSWRQQGREEVQDATTPACPSGPDPGFAVELSDVEELDLFERRHPSVPSRDAANPALEPQEPRAQQQERQPPRASDTGQAAHCQPREGCGDSGGGTRRRRLQQQEQQAHSPQLQPGTAGDLSKSQGQAAGSASKSAQPPSSLGKHPAGVPGPTGTVKLPPLLLRLRRQQPPLQPSSSSVSLQQKGGGRQGQPRALGSSRALKAQQKACEVTKQRSQSSSPAELAPAKPSPSAVQATQGGLAEQQQQQREIAPAGEQATLEGLPAQQGPAERGRRPSMVMEWVKAALSGKPSKWGSEVRGSPSGASAQEQYPQLSSSPSCDRVQLGNGAAESAAQAVAAPDALAATHPPGVSEVPAAGGTGPPSGPAGPGQQRQEDTYAASRPSPCRAPASQCPALATAAGMAAQPAQPPAGPLDGDAMDLDVLPLVLPWHTLPSTSAGAAVAAGQGEESGGGRQLRKRKPKQEEASLQGLTKRLRRREASTQQLPPWAQRRGSAASLTSLLQAAAARQPPCPCFPGRAGPGSGGAGGKPVPGWVALQQAARCPGFHDCRGPGELHQWLLESSGPKLAGAGSAAAAARRQEPGAAGTAEMSLPQAFDRLLASAAASAGTALKPRPSALDQLHCSLSLPPAVIQQHLKAALLAEGLLLAQVAPALAKAAASKHAAPPLARGRASKWPRSVRSGPPGPSLLGVRPAGTAEGVAPGGAAGAGRGIIGGVAMKQEGQAAGQPGTKANAGQAASRLQGRPPKCPPKPSAPGGSDAAVATPAAAAASPERRLRRLGAGFAGPRDRARAGTAAAKGKGRGAAEASCKLGSLKQLSKRKDIQGFHPAVPPLSYLPRKYNS